VEPEGDIGATQDGTRPWLFFVTGAAGAGKSSIVQVLIAARHRHAAHGAPVGVLIFDADWLLEPASALAGQDLTKAEASALWPQYGRVWMRILEMVARNGTSAALFTPAGPRSLSRIRWPVNIDWCLLDCGDATRVARLQARGWAGEATQEAVADARALRGEVGFVIDTCASTPEEAAAQLAAWFAAHR
jgi:hypothetical protein